MPQPAQTGPLAQRLAQVFKLHGKLPLSLDEIVVPVVLVGDVSDELEQLEELEVAGAGSTGVPAAGTRRALYLVNPIDSGVIAFLERIRITVFVGAGASTTGQVDLASNSRGIAVAAGDVDFTDRRVGGDPRLLIERSGDSAGPVVGAGATDLFFSAPHEQLVQIEAHAVLLPGNSIVVDPGTADTPMQCSFSWREQQIET